MPHPSARLVAVLAASAFALSMPSAAAAMSAHAPYMGVDTWYAFGPRIDQQTVETLTDQVVKDGLKAAGYRYLWLDGGWWTGARDRDGNIAPDPTRWPQGMAAIAAYVHSQGMLAGIYTDAGASDCGGSAAGSYGHYQQDANTFAAWGFDAVKVDNCGGTAVRADPRILFTQFSQALADNTSHRPILLDVCNPLEPGQWGAGIPSYANSAFANWSWAPHVATSWRVSYDVGHPDDVRFSGVLHNLAQAAAHPPLAASGHFNDPDYLVPNEGMTRTEAQSQFSMWAIVDAPMMLSTNPAGLPGTELQMVENLEAIAISQDPLGVQGTMVRRGAVQTWVKPLREGRRAVAFLNTSSRTVTASTNASAIGLPRAKRLIVRDVWAHRTTTRNTRFRVPVPAHGTVLLRVAAVGRAPTRS